MRFSLKSAELARHNKHGVRIYVSKTDRFEAPRENQIRYIWRTGQNSKNHIGYHAPNRASPLDISETAG